MQQIATIEAVRSAMAKLEKNGEKVTGRAVLALTGGSLGTVMKQIAAIQEGRSSLIALPREIPEDFQGAVLKLIGQTQQAAATHLEKQISQAKAVEAEAIEGLTVAEEKIHALTDQLAEMQQRFDQFRQEAEKATAMADDRTEQQMKQIASLQTENQQLVASSEMARIETAKANLQLERADQAAQKAEDRARSSLEKVEELQRALADAEKGRAVAEQHAGDLELSLKKCEKQTVALEGEMQKHFERSDRAQAQAKAEIRSFYDENKQLREQLMSTERALNVAEQKGRNEH